MRNIPAGKFCDDCGEHPATRSVFRTGWRWRLTYALRERLDHEQRSWLYLDEDCLGALLVRGSSRVCGAAAGSAS